MIARFTPHLSVLALVAGCGGSSTEATQPVASSDASAATSSAAPVATSGANDAEAEATTFPEKCKQQGNACLPPRKWVERLCPAGNPDVALALFRKGSPFTRAYLAADVKWNASGSSDGSDKIPYDEEVIVLKEYKPNTNGIQVSGAGASYDVTRWDGSCITLQSGELTFNAPPSAKHAKVDFHVLTDATQDTLLKDEKISKTNADRRKECKGVSIGSVSAKCAKLVDQLSELVVVYVQQGGDVPTPEKLR